MIKQDILVIGYPKSGNTWLSRLLGEVLNSPVTGWGSALPLAKEGENRPGPYIVRQLHLRPAYESKTSPFIFSEWLANINGWDGEKIVRVYRDPRDVVVSSFYYWERQTITETIQAMCRGTEPFQGVGDYRSFIESWLNVKEIPIFDVRYEDLIESPYQTLGGLLNDMNIPYHYRKDALEAIEAQSFNNKRAEIESNPSRTEKRPYGMEIQLKNMRKGVVGDWKNHFDEKSCELFHDTFGDLLIRLYYEKSSDWIKKNGHQ